jgi:hypothetical protein
MSYVRNPHVAEVRKAPAYWTQILPVARGAHLIYNYNLLYINVSGKRHLEIEEEISEVEQRL